MEYVGLLVLIGLIISIFLFVAPLFIWQHTKATSNKLDITNTLLDELINTLKDNKEPNKPDNQQDTLVEAES